LGGFWRGLAPTSQLRAGHCWLAPHGKCGAKETVAHVILDCPKLRIARQTLSRETGEAFADISAMLGGKRETSHVKAVLDFAEASGRFRSRGPRTRKDRTEGKWLTQAPRRGLKFALKKWDKCTIETRGHRYSCSSLHIAYARGQGK
jgi:hypothetical protein